MSTSSPYIALTFFKLRIGQVICMSLFNANRHRTNVDPIKPVAPVIRNFEPLGKSDNLNEDTKLSMSSFNILYI